MPCYRSNIHKSIKDFYAKNGYASTEIFCTKLLESNVHKNDKDFRTEIHGEVCESFLECALDEYIKKHKLGDTWFYTKGMVVKDLDGNPNHLTEIDLTLFTPSRVILFECKSYAGNNTLINECTIRRESGGTYDVYKQQKNHLKSLDSNIRSCIRVKGRYVITLFDFSLGSTTDTRSSEHRRLVPLVNSKNIDLFLDKYRHLGVSWDIPRLKKLTQIIMSNNDVWRKKHLAYVKSIR